MSLSKFACYKCGGKTFEDILKHNYDFHVGRKDCAFCGSVLAQRSGVKQHLQHHHRILTGFWEPPPINSKLIVRLGKINFHSVLLDMKKDKQWKIIVKEEYGVLYDESKFTPVAVVEHLKKENLKNKVGERDVDFYPSKELKYNPCPMGFAKMDPPSNAAHMAAAANQRHSKRAFKNTFSTLNLVPMVQGVNCGVWLVIENHVRKLLVIWDDIIVICGPIYDFKSSKPQENVTGLPIYSPTHFFKIILMRRAQEEPFLQAFVVANVFSGDSMFHCRANLEEISARTGLDLSKFSNYKYTWDERESFICGREYCFKTFFTKGELDLHDEFHQTNCKFCNANFETVAELKEHLECHRIFKCEDCVESFPKRKHLKRHIQCVHTKTRPWICDVKNCIAAFKLKQHLKDHLAVHSDCRPYVCDEEDCVASFKCPRGMKQHIQCVHAKTRPWICDVGDCVAAFKLKQHLKDHLASVHSVERPHICEEEDCVASFKLPKLLKEHIKGVHAKTRPWLCKEELCVASFKVERHLKEHMRNVHNPEGPILCTEPNCPSEFACKSGLVRHLRRTHKLVIEAKDVVVKHKLVEKSVVAVKRQRMEPDAED